LINEALFEASKIMDLFQTGLWMGKL